MPKIINTKMPCRYCLLIAVFLMSWLPAHSQKNAADSTKISTQETLHSARKATIYSAVLPGLGQIYNKKYWKVPLVYGGFASLGYFINFNNDLYSKYRQAYSDIIDDDPNTNSFKDLDVNPSFLEPSNKSLFTETLKRAKDGSRRNRDLLIISTAVFYAVNIIDASVDAHFFNFDISDDLTLDWTPGPMICANQKLVGIYCKITF